MPGRRANLSGIAKSGAHLRWGVAPAALAPVRAISRRRTPVTYRPLGRQGRLGNQLWQIASTIGIARARGAPVVLPDWSYRRWFSLPEDLFASSPRGLLGARDSFRYVSPATRCPAAT